MSVGLPGTRSRGPRPPAARGGPAPTATTWGSRAARPLLYAVPMSKLLALALAVPLLACTVGGGDDTGGGGTGPDGGGGGGGGGVSGTIAADATWTGSVTISGQTVIAAGVTVTVEAGTTISFEAGGVGVNVAGVLAVQGTKAAPVTIGPAAAGGNHGGFVIPTGGALELTYAVQTGGGIRTEGGTATIVDSRMSRTSGDFIVMSGGALAMSYSQLGLDAGQTGDTTHCDLHFGGTGNTVSVTHSNIATAPYGLMFYGGTGAVFTGNNWYGNQTHVDTQPGVQGDFTGSWFEGSAPVPASGANLVGLDALATARLADAGPR